MRSFLYKYKYVLFPIVVIFVWCLFFVNITWTDDYKAYVDNYGEQYADIGFDIFQRIAIYFNCEFQTFYNLCLLVQVLLFCLVFYKYQVNYVVALLLTVLFLYVQMANQLRYFIALPLFFLSCRYVLLENSRIKGLIISLLGISFHSGTIPLYLFLLIYYKRKHISSSFKIVRYYVLIGLIILMCFVPLSIFIVNIRQDFSTYLTGGASISGMIYILLMPVFCQYVIYRSYLTNSKVCEYDKQSKHNEFIFYLSAFSCLWMVVSLTGIQVINARYVNAFFPIWLVAIMHFSNKSKNQLLIFILGAFFFKYYFRDFVNIFIPTMNDGNMTELEKFVDIWNSRIFVDKTIL